MFRSVQGRGRFAFCIQHVELVELSLCAREIRSAYPAVKSVLQSALAGGVKDPIPIEERARSPKSLDFLCFVLCCIVLS